MTIDRIIFLRICEDRGIEPYGRLRGLCNGGGTYGRLRALFHEADARYNSGLFHFEDEKRRAGFADRLTLELAIDDKPLKDILKRLYYPDSPYEFSVLPADILGQVYEQFLGKVIRLTAGHRAVVEDKPEVKKAGGVYYTPTYIVDYIVKHTVGRLLEGLTLKQAAALRILDPACGSGTFLIGAYQYLLDWHRDWYVNDGAEKYTKGMTEYVFPDSLEDAPLVAQCKVLALLSFQAVGCRGVSRIDFRVSPEGQPYVLEINTVPGFTATSLLPKAAAKMGLSFSALCARLLEHAACG